jgi:hypothetical protein
MALETEILLETGEPWNSYGTLLHFKVKYSGELVNPEKTTPVGDISNWSTGGKWWTLKELRWVMELQSEI